MAEFKKISDVEVLNAITENDNVVIINSDGALKQTPSGNLGKDITKAEVVEAPAENDTLVIISDGAVKQVSAATFAAAAGGGVPEPIYLLTTATGQYSYSNTTMLDGSPITRSVYDAFITGTPVCVVYYRNNGNMQYYSFCHSAYISEEDMYAVLVFNMQDENYSWVNLNISIELN